MSLELGNNGGGQVLYKVITDYNACKNAINKGIGQLSIY